MFYPAAKGRVIAALVTTGAAFRSRWAASERITGKQEVTGLLPVCRQSGSYHTVARIEMASTAASTVRVS
jgi:hypothetical protein